MRYIPDSIRLMQPMGQFLRHNAGLFRYRSVALGWQFLRNVPPEGWDD